MNLLPLSNSVVQSLMSHLICGVVNELEAHCSLVNNLMSSQPLTPDELSSANQKLVSLLGVLSPVMDVVKVAHPELMPLITFAEGYVSVTKS